MNQKRPSSGQDPGQHCILRQVAREAALPRRGSGLSWCHFSFPRRGLELLTETGHGWATRPRHPQAPGRARRGLLSCQSPPAPPPRLLFRICSLFRSATRRPPPAASRRLPRFLGLRGFPARWRQLQHRQEGLSWAGRGPGGSTARPLHPGRPSKHGHAKEQGRNSSQMRKSCFQVGPEGAEVTCPLGHPEPGRGICCSWREQG